MHVQNVYVKLLTCSREKATEAAADGLQPITVRLHASSLKTLCACTLTFFFQRCFPATELGLDSPYDLGYLKILASIGEVLRNSRITYRKLHALISAGNYSATSNNMKLVHWPLMGGLLHLVQRGEDWAGRQTAQPPSLYQM